MKWTPQRIECNLSPALIYSQVTVLVPVARIILQSCTVTPVKLVSFRRGYFTNNQVGERRRDRTRCYLQCTRRGNMPPNNGALLIFSQELRAVFIHSKNYHRHCSDMPWRPAATAGSPKAPGSAASTWLLICLLYAQNPCWEEAVYCSRWWLPHQRAGNG